MVTDLVEIRRLGEIKAAENLAFRRYLAAHHRGIEGLQELAVEIEREIDCTACANCCRCSIVNVSQPDIEALAAHLGMQPDEAARRYTRPEAEDHTKRVLVNSRGGCIFLDGNLCAVYEARPKACREFPQVTPGAHTLGARLSSLCRWAPLCPIVYNAIENYKRLVGYHRPASAA